MADISLSFVTGLNKTERRLEKNRRQNERNQRPDIKAKNRQYQNERNERPEIKAKNRDCQKNRIANKNQKLAKETEKNTKIFNQYKTGQNENLCFGSRKDALAAAISTEEETVCIFNTNKPGNGIIFYKKTTSNLKKLKRNKQIKAAERYFSAESVK